MPLFELEDLYSDEVITNSDIEGAHLINVWASWCITCRIEHGFLVKLSSQGIPIMGLNYKDERIDAINWITKFGDPYKFIIHDFFVLCSKFRYTAFYLYAELVILFLTFVL